jgi:hypothetical protein
LVGLGWAAAAASFSCGKPKEMKINENIKTILFLDLFPFIIGKKLYFLV